MSKPQFRSAWQTRSGPLLVPVGLFILFLIAAAIRGPHLFSSEGMAGAIIVAAPLILASMALTPIALAGRGSVDLAVGPLVGFVNVTLIHWLVENDITNPFLIFLWVVVAGAAYQLLQGLVIVYVRVAPIIVTLSGYLVLSGVNLVITPRPSGVAPDWMSSWGAGTDIFSPVLFVLLAGFVLWFAISRTSFYTNLKLTGADERMAYTSGINTDAVRLVAHMIGGVYAGLAALSYTALISSSDPTQGSTYTLSAVTALVLGGTSLAGGKGGAIGTIFGALNMYLITYLLATFNFGLVSGFATQFAFGMVLILSLLVNVSLTGGLRHAR